MACSTRWFRGRHEYDHADGARVHYYVCANGNRIEVPCPVAWEYADALTKRIKQIDMKNKKYKVEIPKGYEVNRSYTTKTINHTISTTVVFESIKKELPKTWEEYLSIENKCRPSISNLIVPPKYSEAFKSLGKLIELRDHYNDGWVPDWTNQCQEKYIIHIGGKIIETRRYFTSQTVLAFKTEKLRDEFLSNFRELISTAKPLL